MPKPIGILGGTFDPVHYGHMGLAAEVCQLCDLAEVRLIPLHIPSHRNMPIATPQQRLQMLRLAIQEDDTLLVDDRELRRGDVSFTVDTLRSLRKEVGTQPLCLIMGGDAFQTLNCWHQWTSLIEYAHIVVASRPGMDRKIESAEVSELYDNNLTTAVADLHAQQAGRIFDADISEQEISSTQIRTLIGNSQDVHSLLPRKVIAYMNREGLYHRH